MLCCEYCLHFLLITSNSSQSSVTNGAHIAGVVGGFTAKYAGWRWCYWVPTIILGVTWLINIFCLPETLYRRDPTTGASLEKTRSWKQLLKLKSITTEKRPSLWDITHCFIMLKYPSVLLAGTYYSIAFGAGTVLFAVTGSAAFGGIYHFDTSQVGLIIGIPTTVGSVLGELISGSVSDRFLYLANKRHGGQAEPESRLHATWAGAFILPIGVVIEGVCLQFKTHWIGPAMGIAIAAFGLQIVSTTTFAYLTDCYKPQSAEISTVLNFGRLTFSFTLGFYMVSVTASIGRTVNLNVILDSSCRKHYLWNRLGHYRHYHICSLFWDHFVDV